VQEGLCADIRRPLRLRVEHRIRLARGRQEPEVRVERFERVRTQRANVDLIINAVDSCAYGAERDTYSVCDARTMVCRVNGTRKLIPIKSTDNGRVVPDTAP
jgi:hypothetical protein